MSLRIAPCSLKSLLKLVSGALLTGSLAACVAVGPAAGVAAEITERFPELVERTQFHDDGFDNDEVSVYLRRGVTAEQAEAAYCSLASFGREDLAVTVWLDGGDGAMVFRRDC